MVRKKIIWLVSWYPNKIDKFDGDFVQRHARAAAIYHDIHVMFVGEAPLEKEVEEEWNFATGLTEQWIYFKKTQGIIDRIKKQWTWKNLYHKAIEEYIKKNGQPDGVHVHVPWKSGLIAIWVKKKFGIPFILTEHWGIYNQVIADHFGTKPFYIRMLIKRVFDEAKAFVSVSRFLSLGIERLIGKRTDAIIPNVVDTSLFFPKDEKYNRFTFIHVSNMVSLKNVDLILESFVDFLKSNNHPDVQLIMIGNRDDKFVRMAARMGVLNSSVFFRGEISYNEVAEEMRRSHSLIMNSDMENSPCVIAEALCCGLPVIATGVGGIPELINETNGILVPPRDNPALTSAIQGIWENYDSFERQQIAAGGIKKFSYSAVARQFDNLYQELL